MTNIKISDLEYPKSLGNISGGKTHILPVQTERLKFQNSKGNAPLQSFSGAGMDKLAPISLPAY